MKKFLIPIILLLVFAGVFAEGGMEFVPIYTDLGTSSGKIVDSAATDTAYVRWGYNHLIDSIVVYAFVDTVADSGGATISLKVQTTPDHISFRMAHEINLTTARNANWDALWTIASDVATENVYLVYGCADSTLMSKPGKWARIISEGEGVLERLGIIVVPKSR